MAIIQTRASASNLVTLRRRVRKMLGDKASNTSQQRWLNSDIDQALVDQMFQMYNKLGVNAENFLLSTTMTYNGGVTEDDLPAAVQSVPIYRISDITTNTTVGVPLIQSDALGIDEYGGDIAARLWSRYDLKIKVRPIPSGDITLKIEYLGNPFTMFTYDSDGNPTAAAATTDQHAYPVAHEELICLGAASRLQEEDDENTTARLARLKDLWEDFNSYAKLFRGRKFVRSSRKFC